MPRFSKRSQAQLASCLPSLRDVAREAIKIVDFSVICGYRGKVSQNELFGEGYSKVEWPRSRHNKWPSEAFDIVPWPVNWDDRERFFFLAGVVLTIAEIQGISLRWGGAWDGHFNVKGQFDDLAHFELGR